MKFLIVILLFALTGCSRQRGLPTQFVVPDGYRGVFSVALDSVSGVPVSATNGQFILIIPASGKLLISSWDCIGGRHTVSAKYASGNLLPISRDEAAVALRVVTFKPETKTAVYLIGTQREADEALKNH